ncbi:MAG TPA: proprotein convertase P-domain-containing protein, partial [Calditrichia bacterium]|nr:proprotein convertase P-domain-containing protein [Calditrichia bacterium]
SGDGDGSDTYSTGVLKSYDRGESWEQTGLDFDLLEGRWVRELRMDPDDNRVLLAATNTGVFRTEDGGESWTQTLSGASIKDLEFNPGDGTIVYAAGTAFYRSSNGGRNWSRVTSGLPSSTAVQRLAIAVAPGNPNYVYVVAGDGQGLVGLYRSTNTGQTFGRRSDSPNILNSSVDGSGTGSQAWYDLAIAASPADPEKIYVGGINIWSSEDGGVNWNILSHWNYRTQTVPYVHADIHALDFHGDQLFAGCDGGLWTTPDGGTTWEDISAGMVTTQFYRIGADRHNPNLVIGGTQDNGTNLWRDDQWIHVFGADGMEGMIDYSNPLNLYTSYQNGGLMRSRNGGSTFFNITNGISGSTGWVTPFAMDPVDPKTLYTCFSDVWKSTNEGSNWQKISNFNVGILSTLAIAPSDPQTIYAGSVGALYRTRDGGANWIRISDPLPVGRPAMTYVSVSNRDPERIYISFSGFSDGLKVMRSGDGGDTWENISGTLPNIPVNCVVGQQSPNDALYIGTDHGVFYRNEDLGDWEPFSTNLPNVIVRELEIHPGSGTLKAATYGRGLWISPLEPAGPIIEHAPPGPFEDPVGPYPISATVIPAMAAIPEDSVRVYFGTGGDFSGMLNLMRSGNSDEYLAEIPGLGNDLTLQYYLVASDSAGNRSVSPAGAPGNYYAFYVGADTIAPFLSHPLPVGRANVLDLPVEIEAEASDQSGIASVSVSYAINGAAQADFELALLGSSRYRGSFPFDSTTVSPGDSVTYLITATDGSLGGNQTFAGPFTFPVVEEYYLLGEVNLPIPDNNPDGLSDSLTYPEVGEAVIADMEVLISATHPNFGDLVVRLTSPSGTELTLVDRPGYPADPFWGNRGENPLIILWDEAATSVENVPFLDGEFVLGVFRPFPDSLAAFYGEDLAGTWKIRVIDAKAAQGGILNQWSLRIRTDRSVGLGREYGTVPDQFVLGQNYPNPFNPTTTITFRLPVSGQASLRIFNALGQTVRHLADGNFAAGGHQVLWDGRNDAGLPVASGIYYYQLQFGQNLKVGKMLLLK